MTEKRRGVPNADLQRAQFRKVDGQWQRRLLGGRWEELNVTVTVRQRANGKAPSGQQKVRTEEKRTWEWVAQ